MPMPTKSGTKTNEWIMNERNLQNAERRRNWNWAQERENEERRRKWKSETSGALQFFRVKLIYKCGFTLEPHLQMRSY